MATNTPIELYKVYSIANANAGLNLKIYGFHDLNKAFENMKMQNNG
jgi:hypothetical protein